LFPKSPCKLFIDADPIVREQRRNKQGEADVIAKRDKEDRARAASPLAARRFAPQSTAAT